MKPPHFKRLTREDLDLTRPDWMDRLISVINLFFEQTYTLFNGNITVGDNIHGTVIQSTFTTPSDYTTNDTFNSILLPWRNIKSPQILIIGYIRPADDLQTVIKQPITAQWNQVDVQNIRVDYISGLSDSTKYTVRFLVL